LLPFSILVIFFFASAVANPEISCEATDQPSSQNGSSVLSGMFLSEDLLNHYARFIAIGLGAGSAGLAQSLADQMNKKTRTTP
jgi:hypothetical protein